MILFVNSFKSYIFSSCRVSLLVLALVLFTNIQNLSAQNLKSDVSLGFEILTFISIRFVFQINLPGLTPDLCSFQFLKAGA